jgi:hypothetical protein
MASLNVNIWHNISAGVLNVKPIIYKKMLYINIMEKEHCNIQVIIVRLVSWLLNV